MNLALTVVWANVLFLGSLAIGASVMAAVLVLIVDKYRKDRELTNELADYDKEFDQ